MGSRVKRHAIYTPFEKGRVTEDRNMVIRLIERLFGGVPAPTRVARKTRRHKTLHRRLKAGPVMRGETMSMIRGGR